MTRSKGRPVETRPGTAFVVHVEPKSRRGSDDHHDRDAEARLAECAGLTGAIGLAVVSQRIVVLSATKPATLIGSGKVAEIAAEARVLEPKVIVVNAHLSPVQQRNLEKALGAKVLDRTALISRFLALGRRRAKAGCKWSSRT